MTDLAIRVENLSKLYHIGKAQKRHDTLRDAIADFRLQSFGKLRMTIADWGRGVLKSETLAPHASAGVRNPKWICSGLCTTFPSRHALSEAEGSSAARSSAFLRELRTSIGRNGAGKSTLASTSLSTWLKILSRITEVLSAVEGRKGARSLTGAWGRSRVLFARDVTRLNAALDAVFHHQHPAE